MKTWLMLFGLLLACPLWSAPREITVGKAEIYPVIDGKFNDPAWSKTEWHNDFRVLERNTTPAQQTRFKILHGQFGIYLAISCSDSFIKTEKHSHDYALWNDDCIEVFLIPEAEISSDLNVREYYQFVVNPSGSRYDQFSVGGIANPNWNAQWNAATMIHEKGWDVEIFIPYSSLQLKAGRNTWRLNIGREDHGKSTFEVSTWNPMPKLQALDQFAYLKGLDIDFERYDMEMSGINLSVKPLDGKAVPFLTSELRYHPGSRLTVRCVINENDMIRSLTSQDIIVPDSGRVSIEFPTKITATGDYRLKLFVMDTKGTVYYREEMRRVDVAPIHMEMVKPFYRGQIMSSQPDKEVYLHCSLMVPETELPSCRLLMELTDGGGNAVHREERRNLKPEEAFRFDAGSFKPDKYRIETTLLKDDKAQGKVTSEFRVVPAAKNEIWLNPERQVVINGGKFFPSGFLGCNKDVIQLISECGYNLIHIYTLNQRDIPVIREFLDEAHKLGLMVTFYPFYKMKPGFFGFGPENSSVLPQEGRERIAELVNAVIDHPAFFGWYLYDEPRGAEWCAQLKQVYEFLRKIDPYHPVLGLDNTPMGCINKKAHCDIHVLDLYPGPRKDNSFHFPLASVYSGVALMDRELGREGVWYCPQAFDQDSFADRQNNFRAPTYQETRCVVYASIVSGATGIVPYKIGEPRIKYFERYSNSGIFASPEMKIGFLDGIGPEIKALSPVYLSETVKDAVAADHKDIKIMVKKHQGNYFIFAVNLSPEAIKDVVLHNAPARGRWKVICENRMINDVLKDSFAPYDVHIYTDGDFKDPVDVNEIKKKITAELAKFRESK